MTCWQFTTLQNVGNMLLTFAKDLELVYHNNGWCQVVGLKGERADSDFMLARGRPFKSAFSGLSIRNFASSG